MLTFVRWDVLPAAECVGVGQPHQHVVQPTASWTATENQVAQGQPTASWLATEKQVAQGQPTASWPATENPEAQGQPTASWPATENQVAQGPVRDQKKIEKKLCLSV